MLNHKLPAGMLSLPRGVLPKNLANCRHSCKQCAHTLYVMHYFTWDSLLVIELWRTGEETGSRESRRERDRLSAWETERGLPDRLRESSERRKETEIFSQLSVKSLMGLKHFFFKCFATLKEKHLMFGFARLLDIGLISLYLLLLIRFIWMLLWALITQFLSQLEWHSLRNLAPIIYLWETQVKLK